jgi:hypothetical protein
MQPRSRLRTGPLSQAELGAFGSKRDDDQIRDHQKVARVLRRDRKTQLQRRDSNLKIRERNHFSSLPALSVDLRGPFGHLFGKRLHLNRGIDFLQIDPALLRAFRCIRPPYSVRQFNHADHRQDNDGVSGRIFYWFAEDC